MKILDSRESKTIVEGQIVKVERASGVENLWRVYLNTGYILLIYGSELAEIR